MWSVDWSANLHAVANGGHGFSLKLLNWNPVNTWRPCITFRNFFYSILQQGGLHLLLHPVGPPSYKLGTLLPSKFWCKSCILFQKDCITNDDDDGACAARGGIADESEREWNTSNWLLRQPATNNTDVSHICVILSTSSWQLYPKNVWRPKLHNSDIILALLARLTFHIFIFYYYLFC